MSRYKNAKKRKSVSVYKKLIRILQVMVVVLVLLCALQTRRISKLEQELQEAYLQLDWMEYKQAKWQETAETDFRQEESDSAVGEKEEAGVPGSGQEEPEKEEYSPEEKEESPEEEAHDPEQDGTLRKVYLTFDDGPSRNTNEILDILEQYGVKATFFLIGKEGEEAESAMRRIVEEGHTIGMHSYSHDYEQIYASEDAFAEDFMKMREYIYDVTGVNCVYFRFPGGSSNQVSKTDIYQLIDWVHDQGVEYYDWNISSKDSSPTEYSAEQIAENCLADLERYNKAVVLLHDTNSKGTTVEALPAIIEEIQAMENTVILPITEYTVPIQHRTKEMED